MKMNSCKMLAAYETFYTLISFFHDNPSSDLKDYLGLGSWVSNILRLHYHISLYHCMDMEKDQRIT